MLGSEGNYKVGSSPKIALGQKNRSDYEWNVEITDIRSNGVKKFGFIAADAEQFNDVGDVFTVKAIGTDNPSSPVGKFAELSGEITGIEYGPAVFEGEVCAGGLTSNSQGVTCRGARTNPKEVLFVAHYTDDDTEKAFSTSFTGGSRGLSLIHI